MIILLTTLTLISYILSQNERSHFFRMFFLITKCPSFPHKIAAFPSSSDAGIKRSDTSSWNYGAAATGRPPSPPSSSSSAPNLEDVVTYDRRGSPSNCSSSSAMSREGEEEMRRRRAHYRVPHVKPM